MKLAIEKTIPNLLVHQIDGNELWASSNFTLHRSTDGGCTFVKATEIPVSQTVSLAGSIPLAARALRLGVRTMRKLKSGTVLAVADRKLYRQAQGIWQVVYHFSHGVGPLREGWCEDGWGNCYMGEYLLNTRRNIPVKLLKSENDGASWRVIHTLNGIRHVHCVQYDPITGHIWLGTGDRDRESAISYSEDSGATWTEIGAGNQIYRTVSLLFTQDYIYWGTDAPSRQNAIYRYHRTSGKVERVVEISGPVHYSAMLANGTMAFATSAEGNSEGKSGGWDNHVHIWVSASGKYWEDVVSWEKDRLPYILGYGRVLFAHGMYRGKLFFTPVCVKRVNNRLIQARIEK